MRKIGEKKFQWHCIRMDSIVIVAPGGSTWMDEVDTTLGLCPCSLVPRTNVPSGKVLHI